MLLRQVYLPPHPTRQNEGSINQNSGRRKGMIPCDKTAYFEKSQSCGAGFQSVNTG